MKSKRNLLISIFLSGLLGWIAGYLRLPDLASDSSFLLGFIASLSFFFLSYLLLQVWNKNAGLIKGGSGETADGANAGTKTSRLIWALIALFIVLGGLVSSFVFFKQNADLKGQVQEQELQIRQQAERIEAGEKNNMAALMSTTFAQIDKELNQSLERSLSEETIERIAVLGYSFKPYQSLEGDSLSEKKLSPERGQLLLALSKMNMDSISFASVKSKTSFAEADLRGANLKGADLSGVRLKDANLKDANLLAANLDSADLRNANLWGANLEKAHLVNADLRRTDFRWANLDSANLKAANLDGIDLRSAKLRKANLNGVKIQWANLSGALMVEANLSEADFFGSNLSKTDLKGADLRDANFRRLKLQGANLQGAQMAKASVEETDWLEKLKEWQVIGAKEIQATYKMIDDASGRTKFQLEKLEK